jgi:MoxR-like ATPase
VKAVAKLALIHRIILKPEYEVQGVTSERVIESVLSKVPVPRP